VLEKPKLFLTRKEFFLSSVLLFSLILVRLFFLYQAYQAFKTTPFYYADVELVQAYEKVKEKRSYTVLKVYAPSLNIHFFTTTHITVAALSSKLRLKLYPSEHFSFLDYLGIGYLSSEVNQIYEAEETVKTKLLALIESQHEDEQVQSFYKAIYFAEPLDKSLREQVSALGVSHLIALSGFHLAILSSILYFVLRPLYRVFQARYFPYRYDLYDLGIVVLCILAIYVWFVDAPPSLIRSYGMMFLLWVLLILGMELLSFAFLLTISLILIVIFPSLLLSFAFWFSVAGVFYIFLLLKYFAHLNGYVITLLINFAIFVLMLPIVHTVFPLLTSLQLWSPILSLLFSLFYPLSIILHLFGLGDFLDVYLEQLFTLPFDKENFVLSEVYG